MGHYDIKMFTRITFSGTKCPRISVKCEKKSILFLSLCALNTFIMTSDSSGDTIKLNRIHSWLKFVLFTYKVFFEDYFGVG